MSDPTAPEPTADTAADHHDDHASSHDDDHGMGHEHAAADLGPVDLAAWGAGLAGALAAGATTLVLLIATGRV